MKIENIIEGEAYNNKIKIKECIKGRKKLLILVIGNNDNSFSTIKDIKKVPFVDLSRILGDIFLEIERVIHEIISTSSFISGEYVKKFEKSSQII